MGGAAQVNPDASGTRLGTIFVLYRYPQFSELMLDLTLRIGFPRDLVLGGLNVVVSYSREMPW